MFIPGIELRSPGFTHRTTSQVLTVFWSQTIIQAINNSVVFLQENPESYKNMGKLYSSQLNTLSHQANLKLYYQYDFSLFTLVCSFSVLPFFCLYFLMFFPDIKEHNNVGCYSQHILQC